MYSCSLVSRRSLSVAAGFATLLLTGCALSGGVGSTGNVSGGSGSGVHLVTMGGTVHGGKQAIYNATVKLYAMNTGTANYGDTPTLLATTTTGFDGSFLFIKALDGGTSTGSTYACPSGASTATPGSTGDPEIYLTASGGDTSGSINAGNVGSAYNNTAVKFVLAIGDCESLSAATLVVVNEVTTVGTVVALQQFLNPATEAIGAPSTNVTGLVNAVKMIPNLVDVVGGAAQQSVTPTSTVAGITITATPEYQKLNTMANILAACVSSNPSVNSTACTALANNAVPPASPAVTNFQSISYPTATDTLLAVDYMSINPTESQDYAAGSGKMYNLYSLPSTSTAPFQPTLTAQPIDWTVGVNFVPTGTCTNTTTTAGGPQSLMTSEYSVIVDKNGNIWMGGSGGSGSTGLGDVLAEFNPQGAAIKCLNDGSGSANTAGRRIAIDSQGNVWYATTQGLLEYVTDPGNTAVGTILVWPQPTGIKASGVAADQSGNIYVSPDATAGSIYEYPGVATASTAFAATSILTLGDTSMSITGSPYRDIVINAAGNMVTEGTGGNYVYAYTLSGGSYTDSKVTTTGGASTVYGMAEFSDGTTVGGNTCCARAGGLYQINAATQTMASYSSLFAGGQNADRSVAVDGADNIWTGGATYGNDPTGTLNSVGETDKNYNALSAQGVTLTYTGSSTPFAPGDCGGQSPVAATECQVLGGFSKPFFVLGSIYGMAIDSSGNVWGTPDIAAPSYWVIVGAAVPLKTPIVSNLH